MKTIPLTCNKTINKWCKEPSKLTKELTEEKDRMNIMVSMSWTVNGHVSGVFARTTNRGFWTTVDIISDGDPPQFFVIEMMDMMAI